MGNGQASDETLLDAWRAGDLRAGRELTQRHLEAVARFFGTKLQAPVDDFVQDTFLRCIEVRDRIAVSFRCYLFGIARNVLLEHFRRRHPAIDMSTTSIAALDPSASTVVGEREEQRVLLEALRSLSLDDQITLELRLWEDLRGPEIAEVLGVPEGTVRSRIRRARERLDAAVERVRAAPEALAQTKTDLQRWAQSIREELDP